MTEQELQILKYRSEGKTLEEIGKIYGVTRKRIRQIEKKATRKINCEKSIQERIVHFNDSSSSHLEHQLQYWSASKPDEYYDKLPSLISLRKSIEKDIKTHRMYKELYNGVNTPKLLKEDLHRKLCILENRIYSNEFAIDMCVKGYLLGKNSKDKTPEEIKKLDQLYKLLIEEDD